MYMQHSSGGVNHQGPATREPLGLPAPEHRRGFSAAWKPYKTPKQTKENCAANLIIYKKERRGEVGPGNPITKRGKGKTKTLIGRRRNQLFGELCPLRAHVIWRVKIRENERNSSGREPPPKRERVKVQ